MENNPRSYAELIGKMHDMTTAELISACKSPAMQLTMSPSERAFVNNVISRLEKLAAANKTKRH